MKLIFTEQNLEDVTVTLTDTHRWIESDGWFEVMAQANVEFLRLWGAKNNEATIYLGTNYYRLQKEEDREYELGLPRTITLQEFVDWYNDAEFNTVKEEEGALYALNNECVGVLSTVQIHVNV